MGVLLLFPAALMLLTGWVLAEGAWAHHRAVRPVAMAERLVHDRYVVLADFYDTPPTRGGG